MKEYLVYWKYYWSDEPDEPGYFGWACANERLYDAVEPGDVFWVVVTGGPKHLGEWRLLERIVVKSKRDAPDEDVGYGRFIFEGDAKQTERFRPAALPDFAPVLRSLEFHSGKAIELDGSLIGRAIQSPRRLAPADSKRIRQYLAAAKPRRLT
jgi:hypothetical protein